MKVITRTVLAILLVINIQFIECQSSRKNKRCGSNEQYSAGISPCGTLCSNVGKACNIRNIRATPGCECQKGFARINSTSQCIPVSRCPKISSSMTSCPKNSRWGCGNACSDSCNKELMMCAAGCTNRCICNTGFAMINGECRPKSECTAKIVEGKSCGVNKIQTSCGSACKQTCGSIACPEMCTSGCFCKDGYALINGVCQLKSKCPSNNGALIQSCSKNARWGCGNACSDSCGGETMKCTKECTNRCICNDGYALINGECRPKSECSAKVEEEQSCGVNKIQTSCGSPCSQTCGSLICPTVCLPGCFCKSGYALIDGVCQPKSKCPSNDGALTQSCSKNSRWGCGNACSDSCGKETMMCTAECTNRCICNDGYALINGECRPNSECSAKVDEEQSCGVNKIQTNCGSPCGQTCGNLMCAAVCLQGCFCKPGYALINGECQPKSQCPK